MSQKGKINIYVWKRLSFNISGRFVLISNGLKGYKPKPGKDYWTKNLNKWQLVRNKWDEIFTRNKDLNLKAKVDNKQLYKYLFKEEYSKKEDIDKVIESFVIN